jgi:hypothetical protein
VKADSAARVVKVSNPIAGSQPGRYYRIIMP